ncbi:ATP-binding protein [Streptomyces sp. NBC_01171]|uniref:ATP-binding protein n=1 Tax=Streptomyces sp. NBC_01171 TaxID=2903757 RepID=UPI00386976BC|nr:ATP-binding protein [Streptomyces sp. NBC_01171]
MRTHQRTFPGDPRALHSARNWIHAALNGHPHSDDAALIVTELGTNALTYTASGCGAGTFHVTLTVSELTTTIAVTDSGHAKTTPAIQHLPLNATHGRGLGMVAALAHSVTVQGDDSGRTVTAELHTVGHQGGHPC